MKYLILIQIGLAGGLLLGSTSSWAQQMDLDRVVPPLESNPRTLEDYLVQQAWSNNGQRRELEGEVVVLEAEADLVDRSWLDQIGTNLNFSSQSQEFAFVGNSYTGPGFNVGLSLNLGGFVNQKGRSRVADAKTEVARTRIDQEKPSIRGEVELTLEAVETTRELLRIRRRAEVDAETNYTLVQSLYEQGKAQFEDLAQASEVFFQAVSATALAKSNQTRATIELQTITGLTAQQIEDARRKYAVK